MEKKGFVKTLVAVAGSVASMVGFAFAVGAEPETVDFGQITSALTSGISISSVISIIAAVIGASIAFALLWFGARKIISGFMAAFKKGKIKL